MSENVEGAKNFINEHLVKILWGISLYYLTGLSSDFKDVKISLQAILVNQALVENRITRLEDSDKAKTARWEEYDKDKAEFYRTYKLSKKDGE